MKRKLTWLLSAGLGLALLATASAPLSGQKAPRPPYGQDKMPGPALSPRDAVAKMTVPPGFTVELVASEPDIVNPVAMTFDERGRIWVTESLEYPRFSAGPGRDRIKVLEDTDGDGKIDKVTVFADGLNIPSGIAVGHGGVWVANAPDLLFYKEGPDGKAVGRPEVVVTGFGRDDTHELPNSLTWGPDGWLYGLNGVFNRSRIRHQGKQHDFTCALFRIHPKTREFQLFCEGTSNPWGLAFDSEGSAFVSACVIDHLWHLTETGYYIRQGGPYPPFVTRLGSIVRHRHQKAAYCGLNYFDSDAYPKEYRDRLYMGNIHGGCINVDVLKRAGSTYFATPAPDFLTANDQWFMPVAQKTGPDGCLYVLDWYDRYHCYQDANRDPAGIDRTHGRLYRVRYRDTPRAPKFDLSKESDDKLIERLHSPNVYFRDLAQRLLTERATPAVRRKLATLVLDGKAPRKARMHGLWALLGGGPVEPELQQKLLNHEDPAYRAWAVRAAGNAGKVPASVREKVTALAKDESRDVQLQVAIAARKVVGMDALAVLLEVLARCGDDKLIPGIVWQNLHPLLEERAPEFLAAVKGRGATPNLGKIMPRAIERILARRKAEPALLLDLFVLLHEGESADLSAARQTLAMLALKGQTGELTGPAADALRKRFAPVLRKLLDQKPASPLRTDAAILAATLRDPLGLEMALAAFRSHSEPEGARLRALEALIAARDKGALPAAGTVLGDIKGQPLAFRAQVLSALGKLNEPGVARVLLGHYASLEPNLRPRAVEVLAQRPAWAKELLKAVGDKKVPASAINVNQVRQMLASRDAVLINQVRAQWGTVREGRNPERELVVKEMNKLLRNTPGDAKRGIVVFRNLCAQCHKLHGEGQDVGPDLTSNGRSSFDQLLSNVFDPSLVIGSAYQAVTVETTKGRSLTGLLAEDSPMRVVLKVQGGKQEIVPRAQIETLTVSAVSLMPEGIEKQLRRQEIADLFAYLTLDKHPNDPTARRIPGTPR